MLSLRTDDVEHTLGSTVSGRPTARAAALTDGAVCLVFTAAQAVKASSASLQKYRLSLSRPLRPLKIPLWRISRLRPLRHLSRLRPLRPLNKLVFLLTVVVVELMATTAKDLGLEAVVVRLDGAENHWVTAE